MKKLICSMLSVLLIFSLVACSLVDNIDNRENIPASLAKADEVPETAVTKDATEANVISDGRNVSGFDTKTNQTITWCGFDFSFPSYFNMLHEDSSEIGVHYYPEEEEYYASLTFQSIELSETQEFFNLSIPYIVESTLDGGPFANADIIKSEEISIAGLPGWIITFSLADTDGDGVISTGSYSFVYNINTEKVAMITCGYDSNDQSKYDYLGDFNKVLETAKLLPEPLDLNAINNTSTKDSLEDIAVHFIDVGQADSILIELPNSIEILIDAGNRDDSYTIINYLNNLGIDHIEHFILTHFHEDHIGSAPNVINSFYVDKVYTPETIADTNIYEATMDAINDENIEIIRAKGGMSIIDTANLVFEVLGPNSIYYSNANDYSLVTKLIYGDTSFLFTGDAESASELEMVRGNYDLDVDLLKVGHHGGETSSSQIFLNEVTPEYAVISVGAFNSYGHPHEKTLNRLNAIGAKIYRTDVQGSIVATSDGTNITIDKVATKYVPKPVEEIPVKITPAENEETATESTVKYIGNRNTYKLHYPSCSSVGTMKEENKVSFMSREDAINSGYVPCKRCNP